MILPVGEEGTQKCQKCKYFKSDKLDPDTFYCSYNGSEDCNYKPRKPRKPLEKPLEKPQLINDHIVGLPVKWQR